MPGAPLRLIVVIVLALSGCFGGELRPTDGDDDAPPPTGPDAAPLPCEEPVAQVESGTHYPGSACQSCHGAGGSGPRFTLAGTAYEDADGATAMPHATVTVIDADQRALQLPVAQNGNFWTTETLTFPVRVQLSLCPDAQIMTADVPAPGDCNAGSCHGNGKRVYLR
jgi:hypothetical protein